MVKEAVEKSNRNHLLSPLIARKTIVIAVIIRVISIETLACAGFILAGAEKKTRFGQKKNQGGAESRPKGAKISSAPRAEFDFAPGAEQTGGGAENLIIPRERGKNV